MYEGDDLNYEDDVEAPPEESSNRTFLIAAGILGGIVLLSIACLAGYALLILPQQNAARQTQSAIETQNAGTISDALTRLRWLLISHKRHKLQIHPFLPTPQWLRNPPQRTHWNSRLPLTRLPLRLLPA